MLRTVKLWLLAALIAGASPLAAQTRMYKMQEFEPSQFHETIYELMVECTGVEGDFEAVRWYVAATIVAVYGKQEYWGVWHEDWGWPAIVLDREHVFDGEIVSHEVMHDLYKGQGPMDKYRICVLDWENLTPILRFDTKSEDHPYERPQVSTTLGSSGSAMRPEGLQGP